MFDIIRYFLRHKARTSLTILAVAVGIFAVTAVGGIAEQLESVIQATEADARGRVSVSPEAWDRPLTEVTVRQLRRVEGVAGVTVTVADLLEEPEESNVQVVINPEIFTGTRSDVPGLEFQPWLNAKLWDGRLPRRGSRTETVVSWDIAQKYGLAVGDTFVIRDRPFRVVGIWERTASAAAPRAAYVAYDVAQELATSQIFGSGIGSVQAILQPGMEPEDVVERIEAEVDGVDAQSPREAVGEIRQQVLVFSLIVGASGMMALLIGTFTIVNTMLVSIHERRREIGLKKALGAADTHVLAEVMVEAAIIGGVGGLLGVSAGLGVAQVANRVLSAQLGSLLFLITPRLAVGAFVFTVLMGVLAGLYPAWQAAHLDPVVALRGGGGVTYARRGFRRLVYLVRRNARSILTVGGIAIGIFALAVLGSVAEVINGFWSQAIEATGGMVFVFPEDPNLPFGRSTARVMRAVPGVREVVLANGAGSLDEEEEMTGNLFGTESPSGEYGGEMPFDVDFAAGRNLAPGSLTEVVVGASLAQQRGLEVGDTLTIRGYDFTVVGIWERIPFDISVFNLSAYITLDALAMVLEQPDPIAMMTALVTPGVALDEMAQIIEDTLPGVDAQVPEEVYGDIRQLFALLIAVMAGLLSIAVFVGGVSVVNTMVIAVSQRTQEIGLKKAIGAEDSDILAEVLADAGKLGTVGGVVGVLLAGVVAVAFNIYAQQNQVPEMMAITPRLVVGAVIFGTLLGMVAGLFPAWRAARLDPVVALRTE
jgi:putative ABC transport system permease protein